MFFKDARRRRDISLNAKYALLALSLSSIGGEAREPLIKLWATNLRDGSKFYFSAVMEDFRVDLGVLKLLIDSKKLLWTVNDVLPDWERAAEAASITEPAFDLGRSRNFYRLLLSSNYWPLASIISTFNSPFLKRIRVH